MNKLYVVLFSSLLAFTMEQTLAASKTEPVVATKQAEVLNLNHVGVKQLQQLPGIGKKKAQDIVAYRQKHNGFKSVNELEAIKGISERLLKKIKPHLRLQ